MAITSSVLTEQAPQRDGRMRVSELHTDHRGLTYVRTYIANAEEDLAMALAAYAVQLDAQTQNEEGERNLRAILDGRFNAVTAQYLTVAQVRQRLRAFYQQATGAEVAKLAAFFLTLTDNQLQTLFGVSAGQVAALKTRLQARVDAGAAADTLAGE